MGGLAPVLLAWRLRAEASSAVSSQERGLELDFLSILSLPEVLPETLGQKADWGPRSRAPRPALGLLGLIFPNTGGQQISSGPTLLTLEPIGKTPNPEA